jgi:hypothetical protein
VEAPGAHVPEPPTSFPTHQPAESARADSNWVLYPQVSERAATDLRQPQRPVPPDSGGACRIRRRLQRAGARNARREPRSPSSGAGMWVSEWGFAGAPVAGEEGSWLAAAGTGTPERERWAARVGKCER